MTRPSRQFFLSLLLLCGAILLVVGARLWLATPPDEYTDHTPPAGANAKPDPPNPDKSKRMPGAARPG